MIIEKVEGEHTLPCKRVTVPFRIKTNCPGCGAEFINDLSQMDQYELEYLTLNKPITSECWCEECDLDWTVMYKINISLTPIVPDCVRLYTF